MPAAATFVIACGGPAGAAEALRSDAIQDLIRSGRPADPAVPLSEVLAEG